MAICITQYIYAKVAIISEQTIQFRVDAVGDEGEVLGTVQEIQVVHVDGDQAARVAADPLLVPLVQAGQVLDGDALLVVAAALGDLRDEVLDGALQVDQQVRLLHHFHHHVVGVHERVVVPLRQVPLRVVVRHEDVHAFHHRAVLDDDVLGLADLDDVVQPLVQEVHLQGEGPALDVGVVVRQVIKTKKRKKRI